MTNCVLDCGKIAYPISPYTCERCKKSCCKECFLNWMLERRNCVHCRNPIILSSSMVRTLDSLRRERIQARMASNSSRPLQISEQERFDSFIMHDVPLIELNQEQTTTRRRQPQPTMQANQGNARQEIITRTVRLLSNLPQTLLDSQIDVINMLLGNLESVINVIELE